MSKKTQKSSEKPQFYTIPMDIMNGSALFNLADGMTVSAQEKLHISRLTEKFLELFPESKPDFVGTRGNPNENRKLDITRREILAVANGLITLFRKPEMPFSGLQRVAKKWQIWGYVEGILEPDSSPEFDGELDGAPEPLDPSLAANAE